MMSCTKTCAIGSIRNYRDELRVADLRDPPLMAEVDHAFAELSRILNLPGHFSDWRALIRWNDVYFVGQRPYRSGKRF